MNSAASKKITLTGIDCELAKRSLIDFTTYTMPSYYVSWHHKYIADKLTDFAFGKIKNLMLSLGPQHGKTELATRRLTAFLFGINPDFRIAGCSYNDTYASKYNRQIQRIMDNEIYYNIFPETKLNSKRVVSDHKGNYLRNTSEFEIIGHSGSYLSVGVGGGITGNPVDILIMDDLIKGREAANSTTYREKLWEWYTDEASTRLHNDSQQLLIMTRWHYDDIAGRIIDREAEEWEIINIESIKETESDFDPREIGDALWPEKHSKKRLEKVRLKNPKTFYSLYQGQPSPEGGNKFKEDHFEIVTENEIPENIIWEMYVDGAYTKDTTNDPTGIMICGKYKGKLYIKTSIDKWLELPELIEFMENFYNAQSLPGNCRIFIEPKASGQSLRQHLERAEYNAIDIKHSYVNKSKIERVDAILPYCDSGKVKLIKGSWNHHFIEQLKRFPNAAHDEHVDMICYALLKNFYFKVKKTKRITNISQIVK